MQDERIIRLYLDRSEEAITETSEKYGSYCHVIAWNILFDPRDTEECVNDTWLRTWNSIPPARPVSLKAFVGRITRNLALNMYEYRRAGRRGGGEVPLCLDELAECVGTGAGPEMEADRIAVGDCLERFLAGEKPLNRMIFVRRYWYAASVKEIAREYRLGESRVKMMLQRSRNRLRKILEEGGVTV